MNDFDIFAVMNSEDTKNGTKNLAIGIDFKRSQQLKNYSEVVFAIDNPSHMDLVNGRYFPLILLVDRKRYGELKNANPKSENSQQKQHDL